MKKRIFLGEVDFRFSDFSSRSDFHRATFQAYADFGFAEFNRDVSFDNSNFRKRAKFLGAVFSMKANFRGVKFTMSVNFGHATFNGGVDFSFASFSEKCVFYRASFMKVTRFINCTFAEMVNFTEATFKDTAIFVARDEKADAPRIFAGVKVDFRWVLIDPSCLITMRNADLRKCRFFGTNLRRIDVVGAKWPQTGDNRFAVYDEIAPLKEAEVLSWDGIEELYRQLKQNFEDRRDYERAGDFHRSEKEMRRRHPEIEGTWRIPLEVYKWLSGYGENYLLPLVWAFVLFICSTVGYLSLGLFSTRMDRELVWGSLSDLLTAGLYSLRVMFFLKPLDLYPVDCRGTLLLTIESLLGPLLIGFFALALRQRLKR